ncbi:MAG: hypothetical protein HKN67_11060 [Saprospiraceae bacterium]|nr:hypothetical protein [Saprospiraceae bacterium]
MILYRNIFNMKMGVLCILLLLVSCISLKSQNSDIRKSEKSNGVKGDFEQEGSFIIAGICKDGILIASDKRFVIYDTTSVKPKPLAYFDGIQKIWIVDDYVLAMTGTGATQNYFITHIIEDFTVNKNSSINFKNYIPQLLSFVRQNYPDEFIAFQRNIIRNKFFIAGYDQDIPKICAFSNYQTQCISGSGFIESDMTENMNDYDYSLTFDGLGDLMKNSIVVYSSTGDNWKKSGNTVDIVSISNNQEPVWYQRSYSHNLPCISDLKSDVKNGDLKIQMMKSYSLEELYKLF